MEQKRQHFLLPALVCAGSFLCLMLVLLLTNPVQKIAFVVVFFGALLVFLLSFGYLTVLLKHGHVKPKSWYKIFVLSVFVTVLLMFRSARSLGVVDIMVLLFIILGMFFYISRRSTS